MNTQKIKILLVDDDILFGNSVAHELNKRGYETKYLSTVYGVSDTIMQFSPDMLVVDVVIGKENVIDVVTNLFKGVPALPIIFISSHYEDHIKESGLLAGAVACIDKPFSIKLLIAYIDRFTRISPNPHNTLGYMLAIGTAQLNIRNRTLMFSNEEIIDLCPMDFKIIRELALHISEVVSRSNLYYAIWEGDIGYYNDQSLNNSIRRLRTFLDAGNTRMEIKLHKGFGYKLKEF